MIFLLTHQRARSGRQHWRWLSSLPRSRASSAAQAQQSSIWTVGHGWPPASQASQIQDSCNTLKRGEIDFNYTYICLQQQSFKVVYWYYSFYILPMANVEASFVLPEASRQLFPGRTQLWAKLTAFSVWRLLGVSNSFLISPSAVPQSPQVLLLIQSTIWTWKNLKQFSLWPINSLDVKTPKS